MTIQEQIAILETAKQEKDELKAFIQRVLQISAQVESFKDLSITDINNAFPIAMDMWNQICEDATDVFTPEKFDLVLDVATISKQINDQATLFLTLQAKVKGL